MTPHCSANAESMCGTSKSCSNCMTSDINLLRDCHCQSYVFSTEPKQCIKVKDYVTCQIFPAPLLRVVFFKLYPGLTFLYGAVTNS